jgi:hypothetical protein
VKHCTRIDADPISATYHGHPGKTAEAVAELRRTYPSVRVVRVTKEGSIHERAEIEVEWDIG